MKTLNNHQRLCLAACRRADLLRVRSGFWEYRHKSHIRLFSSRTIDALEQQGLVLKCGARVVARENIR